MATTALMTAWGTPDIFPGQCGGRRRRLYLTTRHPMTAGHRKACNFFGFFYDTDGEGIEIYYYQMPMATTALAAAALGISDILLGSVGGDG